MLMRLSQGQLNTLTSCPRKFQHLYLDQLGFPPTPEQQDRITWGSRFHRLMQQRQLGLSPIAAFEQTSEGWAMQQCIEALVEAAPELFQSDAAALRETEHRRTLEFQGYLLTVIYDLLILNDRTAQILDWKTYPQPQNSHRLAQDWQTRLYPFVLAETSHYVPEQISMTYWFVQPAVEPVPAPQPLQFSYTTALHQQAQQDLNHLLNQLTLWLQGYETDEPLPQIEQSAGHCRLCPFAIRCQREPAPGLNPQSFSLESIQEIVL